MSYTATGVVKAADSQVGYRESGVNLTKYNDWLGRIPGYGSGGRSYPWCMSFQAWLGGHAGGKANVDYPKTAGCAVAVGWFKARGRWSSTPHVGDMVFYGPGGSVHVELVVAVTSSTITTVGGNTGGSLNGRYHEGDGVYQKTVARSSSRIYGYGRPLYVAPAPFKATARWPYKADTVMRLGWNDSDGVRAVQKRLGITADGDFGPATEAAVRAYQKRTKGLTVDGEVGPKTWARMFEGK